MIKLHIVLFHSHRRMGIQETAQNSIPRAVVRRLQVMQGDGRKEKAYNWPPDTANLDSMNGIAKHNSEL